MTNPSPPKFSAALLIASALVVLTGCSSAEPSGIATASSIPTVAATQVADLKLPADVTALGVITAVVLLQSADVQEAVSAGLVTPSEIDYARAAISDKTVKAWRDRAEAELATGD